MRKSIREEITEILGWFGFEDEAVHVHFPNLQEGVVDTPIIAHECTHRALVLSTTFGSFQRILSLLKRRTQKFHFQWADLSEMLDLTIEQSEIVHEATAVYHQLLSMNEATPDHINAERNKLPSFYAKALALLEHTLPLPSHRSSHSQFCYNVASSVIAQMALNNRIISHSHDIFGLDLPWLKRFLTDESPNKRFETLCQTIAQKLRTEDALAVIDESIAGAASGLGHTRISWNEHITAEIVYTPAEISKMAAAAEEKFMGYLCECVATFPTFSSRDAITREIETGIRAWRKQFTQRGLDELFPITEIHVAAPGDEIATTRNRRYFPEKFFRSEMALRPAVNDSGITDFLHKCDRDEEIPLLHIGTTAESHNIVLALAIVCDRSEFHLSGKNGPICGPISPESLRAVGMLGIVFRDIKCAWHMRRELAESMGLLEGYVLPGIAIFSESSFDEKRLDQLIGKFKRHHGKATIRNIADPNIGLQCILISGLKAWFAIGIPCDDTDYRSLIDRYELDQDVMSGKPEQAREIGINRHQNFLITPVFQA